MRASVLLLTLFAACTGSTTAPGTSCSPYAQDCPDAMTCYASGCYYPCEFEGDCDPSFACVETLCLPTCNSGKDCQFPLACNERTDGRRGQICTAQQRTCFSDEECSEVCAGNICTTLCNSDEECGSGFCTTVDARLVCSRFIF